MTGIKTNSALLLSILRDAEFRRGEIFTRWLDERLPQFLDGEKMRERDVIAEDAAIFAALLHRAGATAVGSADTKAGDPESRWKRTARFEQVKPGDGL